jgi:hypothetical protein
MGYLYIILRIRQLSLQLNQGPSGMYISGQCERARRAAVGTIGSLSERNSGKRLGDEEC